MSEHRSRILLLALAALTVTAFAAGPADSPNAALLYWRALGLMPPVDTARADLLKLYSTAPVDLAMKQTVEAGAPALECLLLAGSLTVCDWGTASAGPLLPTVHLRRLGELGRMAALSAHYHLAIGRYETGVDHLLALLTMARRVGGEGLPASYELELELEREALPLAADFLPRLPPAALDRFAAGFAALPAGGAAVAAIDAGKRRTWQAIDDRLTAIGTEWEDRYLETMDHIPWAGLRILGRYSDGQVDNMIALLESLNDEDYARLQPVYGLPSKPEAVAALAGFREAWLRLAPGDRQFIHALASYNDGAGAFAAIAQGRRRLSAMHRDLGAVYDEVAQLAGQPVEPFLAASSELAGRCRDTNPWAARVLPGLVRLRLLEAASQASRVILTEGIAIVRSGSTEPGADAAGKLRYEPTPEGFRLLSQLSVEQLPILLEFRRLGEPVPEPPDVLADVATLLERYHRFPSTQTVIKLYRLAGSREVFEARLAENLRQKLSSQQPTLGWTPEEVTAVSQRFSRAAHEYASGWIAMSAAAAEGRLSARVAVALWEQQNPDLAMYLTVFGQIEPDLVRILGEQRTGQFMAIVRQQLQQ